MKIAYAIGGADCVWRDLAAADALVGSPEYVLACNNIGIELPRLDHWISLHPQKLDRWAEARRLAGLPDPVAFWSYKQVEPGPRVEIRDRPIDGSSGLFTVAVALEFADRVICCGIPMDRHGYFDGVKEGKGHSVHKHLGRYRPHWMSEKESGRLARVRSMSGWTAELLGRPDAAWLSEAA